MEQIGGLKRSSEWKEGGDDVSTLCDAAVFPAVDYRAQEAGLHGDFHTESPAWLDGNRMDCRNGLGLRSGRSARFCVCRPSALLHAMRRDESGRPFLPNLRSSAVVRAIRASARVR